VTEQDQPACAVLAVAPLTPEMGHDILLQAFAGLADLDWTLTIAGNGPAGELTRQADGLGLGGRTRIVPDPEPAALDALWATADLFALAARAPSPAALAALERGLPVAVSEAVGLDVPVDAGVICATEDAAALGRALRRLIYDRPLRQSLAEGARRAGREP